MAFDDPLGAVGMVSKSGISSVFASPTYQDRVFWGDSSSTEGFESRFVAHLLRASFFAHHKKSRQP